MTRTWARLVPLAVACWWLGVADLPAADYRSRPAVEVQVELAWLADPVTFPYMLEARMEGGQLRARGYVPSPAVREHALKLARMHCPHPVSDALQINPRVQAVGLHLPAEHLQVAVRMHLQQAFPGRSAPLSVRCRRDGTVTVSGKVPTLEQKLAVSQALRRLHGCNCVINQLEVPASAQAHAPGANPFPWESDPPKSATASAPPRVVPRPLAKEALAAGLLPSFDPADARLGAIEKAIYLGPDVAQGKVTTAHLAQAVPQPAAKKPKAIIPSAFSGSKASPSPLSRPVTEAAQEPVQAKPALAVAVPKAGHEQVLPRSQVKATPTAPKAALSQASAATEATAIAVARQMPKGPAVVDKSGTVSAPLILPANSSTPASAARQVASHAYVSDGVAVEEEEEVPNPLPPAAASSPALLKIQQRIRTGYQGILDTKVEQQGSRLGIRVTLHDPNLIQGLATQILALPELASYGDRIDLFFYVEP